MVIMEKKTLIHSSVIAAIIIAAALGVGMVTGFPGIHLFASAGPASDMDTGSRPVITETTATDTAQYISIDPVADKTTGDLLIVSGSTNLPAGTVLMVQAGGDGVGYGGDTRVREGTGGINRFSAPVDTSLLKPGTRTVTVTNMKGDLAQGDYGPGTVSCTATFILKGTYLGADTPVQATVTTDDYIRINPIDDHAAGDQFLVTGTTSLPVGTNILWQVIPEDGKPGTGSSPTGDAGIMANNGVTQGDGTANRVSLAVDTGNLKPGRYVAMAARLEGDMRAGDVRMGDLAGSAGFTLK